MSNSSITQISDFLRKKIEMSQGGNVFDEASDPATTPERLRDLMKIGYPLTLTIARNPSCSVGLIEDLLEDGNSDVERAAAFNESCPIEISVLKIAEMQIEAEDRAAAEKLMLQATMSKIGRNIMTGPKRV